MKEKRIIVFILIITLALPLCGCGKSEAVKNAIKAINQIGEVTLDSGAAIVYAEEQYNLCVESEIADVKNRLDLIRAREEYEELVREYIAEIREEFLRDFDVQTAIEKYERVIEYVLQSTYESAANSYYPILNGDWCYSGTSFPKLEFVIENCSAAEIEEHEWGCSDYDYRCDDEELLRQELSEYIGYLKNNEHFFDCYEYDSENSCYIFDTESGDCVVVYNSYHSYHYQSPGMFEWELRFSFDVEY